MKLVECVPNISEGRNDSVIDEIVKAASLEHVAVLDVARGRSTNRTVITLAAPPQAALEAAFCLIRRSAELIDMRRHKGEHPRIGATDVCPFVPLEGTTVQECIELAKELGRRVARELGLPVYLYGQAASKPERQSLSFLRQGEYEGIPKKFADAEMAPDFGAAVFNERSGATIIGVRPFLIAYNINLNTRDKKAAQEIAVKIRESGGKKKEASGHFVLDAAGKPVIEPGLFKCCAAVGWYIEEFGIAQVSINLTDFSVTPLEAVFDAVCDLAAQRGLRVTGSEIVGLVPKKALLQAGVHYLRRQGAASAVPESELYAAAVRSLGLNEIYPFKIKDKVIEEKIKPAAPLLESKLGAFIDCLSQDSPVPGGGSVSALAGSLAAALVSMVSALTFGKSKTAGAAKTLQFELLGQEAQKLKQLLCSAIDQDSAAFDKVLQAFRIQAVSAAEKAAKEEQIVSAYIEAAKVPLHVMHNCLSALKLAEKSLEAGLPSAFSDSAVAAQMAYAGLLGASYNVSINLKELANRTNLSAADKAFLESATSELGTARKEGEKLISAVNQRVHAEL